MLYPFINGQMVYKKPQTALKAMQSEYNIQTTYIVKYRKYVNSLNINPKYIEKVKDISLKLNIHWEYLVIVIYHESHFNPRAINDSTKAVGLIQFMPSTINGLGLEWDTIYNMSVIEQLDIVYMYYSRFKIDNNPYSLWMTVFYPYALRKLTDDNYIIGSEKSMRYANKIALLNKGFDLDKNGYITIKEYKQYHDLLIFK